MSTSLQMISLELDNNFLNGTLPSSWNKLVQVHMPTTIALAFMQITFTCLLVPSCARVGDHRRYSAAMSWLLNCLHVPDFR